MDIIQNGVVQQRAIIRDDFIHRGEKRSMLLFRLAAMFLTWRKRATERDYLLTSDHRLRVDLLASDQQLEREVAKPFWRS